MGEITSKICFISDMDYVQIEYTRRAIYFWSDVGLRIVITKSSSKILYCNKSTSSYSNGGNHIKNMLYFRHGLCAIEYTRRSIYFGLM